MLKTSSQRHFKIKKVIYLSIKSIFIEAEW